MLPLTVCLDSNVIISGIAFRGKPFKILERALEREFNVVLGPPILDEVRRNLIGKLESWDNVFLERLNQQTLTPEKQ